MSPVFVHLCGRLSNRTPFILLLLSRRRKVVTPKSGTQRDSVEIEASQENTLVQLSNDTINGRVDYAGAVNHSVSGTWSVTGGNLETQRW